MKKILHYIALPWRWYTRLFKGRPWYVKILSAVVSAVLAFFLYLVAVDVNLLGLFGKSPGMSTIRNKQPDQASEIYSADGKQLGKFFNENRTPVEYSDVNPVFWQALIDTEDERFYSHHGIDYQAFLAALKDYAVRRDARGASTITQQLAKNLFRTRSDYSTGLLGNIPGVKMLILKSKEWITAYKLEYFFSKEEILTQYANTVDFGSNSFGIKTACKTYFGTTPKLLTTDQAAILVGMLKATTYYNPRLHPDNAIKRRNVVLANMLSHGHLTQAEFDRLKNKPIEVDYNIENTYDGQENYFREAVANSLKSWCETSGYDIYTDGLKIYTTLDTRLQRHAEDAVREQMEVIQQSFDEHWGKANPWRDMYQREIPGFIEDIAKRQPVYKYLEKKFNGNTDSIWASLNRPHTVKLFDYKDKTIEREMSTLDSIRYMVRFMHCGLVAMEPQTGHVKAWVGDIDFSSWKYDKVTAERQPGSTFKIFVYTEAMNQGMSPCDTRQDSYFSMRVYDEDKKQEVVWAPHNADAIYTNRHMMLKSAFAESTNTIAAKLGQEVGIKNIIKTAHAMGIESPLADAPSLALGPSDVNLLELTNSYSTIVNDGKVFKPVLVSKIEDRNGKVVYTAPAKPKEAVPYRSAYLMQQMFRATMHGTSASLWKWVRPYSTDTDFGGKTGTSNNHSDAWFIGTTPRLVCGVWVGGEYRSIHFRTGELGQGNRTALPVCGQFMKRVFADPLFKEYHARFAEPKDPELKNIASRCMGIYVPSAYKAGPAGQPEDGSQPDNTGSAAAATQTEE